MQTSQRRYLCGGQSSHNGWEAKVDHLDCERSQSAIDIVLATFLLNLDCCLLYLHGIISGSSYTTVGCSACDCWIIISDVGVQTSWNTALFSEKGGVRINRVF